MARTEHLPIYKASYDLCLYLEQVVHGFSRYHKYTLSTDLRDAARRALAQRLKVLWFLRNWHSRYRTGMQTLSPSPRFSIRSALTATCLIAFAQCATAQSASPDANTDVLTVRISADGVCNFLDDSALCEQLGKYLLTKHPAQKRHLHITVDRASKYELVAATLKSLEGTGFKVGFVNTELSTKQAISEGNYIGYATVADALATLKAQGLLPVPGINGEVSFAEPDNKTTWTFVGKDDPAYPSAVRYVFGTSDGPVLHVEIAILCEASEEPCEKFRSVTRENVTQLSKMMAGDPWCLAL
jgi:biopolymer transport protein ExbD